MNGLFSIPDENHRHRRLIAAGPITRQPGTAPYRVVLLELSDNNFSVHNEIFCIDDPKQADLDDGRIGSGLSRGDYFSAGEFPFVRAMERFVERVSHDIKYYESLYR